ncbi:MAG: ABC transporter permease [Lachnospiraceae bacterium]|nr:ABC transporter permease [Lachnospiraceae bacterium]
MKQYGAMRAVGMSVRQMTKMIAAEAVTYAVCGMVIGLAGGLYMHRLLMNKLIYSHFGGTWSIPFEPIIIVLLIFVLACAAAVHAPVRRIRGMAITETVNEL